MVFGIDQYTPTLTNKLTYYIRPGYTGTFFLPVTFIPNREGKIRKLTMIIIYWSKCFY